MNAISMLTEARTFSQIYELVEAENATLILRDERGQRKIMTDMMSAYGAVNFGHLNPSITPYVGLKADIVACFYPRAGSDFASWIVDKLRLTDHLVLYQIGGSAAVSAAFAMAQRIRSGRILAIEGGFHGLGVDTLAASTRGRGCAVQESRLVNHVESLVSMLPVHQYPSDWSDISCLIYEPVQGANGYVPLPLEWLKRLEQLAHRSGVITIADEIQSGFYRHGALSVARQNGLSPDILLFSKSMTNGLYPMSALIYPELFHEKLSPEEVYWTHTFQTSSIGCEAAWAVARYIENTDIGGLVTDVSAAMTAAAGELMQFDRIYNTYVTGPTLSFGVKDGQAREVVLACEQRGQLIFTGGPHRVRIAPPLTMPKAQLKHALSCILEAVESCVGKSIAQKS